MWVCYRKKIVRTTGTQGRPVDLRDRVDAFSITPNVSLDSGTPAAPREPVPPKEVIRNSLRKSSVNLSGIENFDFQTCVLDLKTCPKVALFDTFSGRVRGSVFYPR